MIAPLVAENLAIRLGGRTVLQNANLQLRSGTVTAFLGENGSGKSTLVRALAGLLQADQGCVRLDGRPISGLTAIERSNLLSCVLQESHLGFDFLLLEVIALGPPAAVPPNVRRKQAADAMNAVGISPLAKRPWSTLSGGERQRGHLARALASRAPVLLLDEPQNHLDLASRVRLRAVLRAEADRGAAVLFTTHHLEEAAWADDLLILAGGATVESGTPTSVLRPACIERVFAVQAHELIDPLGGPPAFRLGPLKQVQNPLPEKRPSELNPSRTQL